MSETAFTAAQATWRRSDIGELLSTCGGSIKTGPFGTKLKAGEYTPDGVPVISVGEIDYGRLVLRAETPKVNDSVTARMPEFLLQEGDIVFGRKGAVDRSARVRRNQHGWFLGSDGIRLRLPSACDAAFVAYQFQLKSHREWMLQHAAGSTMPSLNEGIIRRVPVVLPSLAEQRAIAGALSSLDDKIEQNRQTARALERLARAIFRAWFVDFEPVKAKAAGANAFPSMPQPVFDALPTRFIDSVIGPVPEGWLPTAVSSAFQVNPARSLRRAAPAPFLDMKNMPTEGHAPDSWIVRPFGSGMRFMNGDTLVARITPCLENGKTAFVDFLDDDEIAWGSTEYIVLRPKAPLPAVFAYCLARTSEFRGFAIQNMTGTSGRQRVAPTAMDHFRIAMPSESAAVCFGEIAQPLFTCIRTGMNELRKLAAMRDYLLPKLLSGQVHVGDAHG